MGAFIRCIAVSFTLSILRQHPTPISEMWRIGPYFLRMLAYQLILILGFFSVAAICVAPCLGTLFTQSEPIIVVGGVSSLILLVFACALAIFVWCSINLTWYFIVDDGSGVVESMKRSMAYMRGNKLIFFTIGFVTSVIVMVGTICTCCLGWWLLFAPYWWLVMAIVYFSATGQPIAYRAQHGQKLDG